METLNFIKQTLQASLAPATTRAYTRHLSEFQGYLRSKGIACTYPHEVGQIMAFIATKRQQALQYPTLQAYASAIAFAHKIRGLTDPTSSFLFRKFMTGLRRSSHSSNPLQPVTKTMLEELIGLVSKLNIDNFSKI